ncbi:MAG TPA: TonB C-terminal domain-containing protein [Noviherbaspirillum sp.]|nr:TonB C-terminal domain-containing protein [Noviherbaspirillum sp.]HJV83623.1 TonB C-terminal domain-containing protein [Noviherbaspirillum sp.]
MLLSENRTLSIAVAASVLVHGALLAVRFAAPDAFQFKPMDPGLEVILVNAKHDKKPIKAEALAQANLDGGGNADAGRSKSPLPDMRKTENGEGLQAIQRRIEELEKQQRMLAHLNRKSPFATTKDPVKPRESRSKQDAVDAADSDSAIARREAEISRRIEDENKRPKKTFISPSTREVGYAMYFDSVRQRIEKFGTLNFPQKDGKKLYGELTMSISIFQDGKIYTKDRDEGITVERSSGNPALDEAARRIVRRAAPFGAFAKNMRSADKDDVWVMTTRFKFTRDDALEAQLQGGIN